MCVLFLRSESVKYLQDIKSMSVTENNKKWEKKKENSHLFISGIFLCLSPALSLANTLCMGQICRDQHMLLLLCGAKANTFCFIGFVWLCERGKCKFSLSLSCVCVQRRQPIMTTLKMCWGFVVMRWGNLHALLILLCKFVVLFYFFCIKNANNKQKTNK